MATRPIKDYNVTFIEGYRAFGAYEEIALNGLGEYEIGEIILKSFDSGVSRISPQIVKVIQVSLFTRILPEFVHLPLPLHRTVLVEIPYTSSK